MVGEVAEGGGDGRDGSSVSVCMSRELTDRRPLFAGGSVVLARFGLAVGC